MPQMPAEVLARDWRKASRSVNNGACVEVGWRTSTRSVSGGNCAELAPARPGVLVRDTRDRAGTWLAFPPRAWAAFTASLKTRD